MCHFRAEKKLKNQDVNLDIGIVVCTLVSDWDEGLNWMFGNSIHFQRELNSSPRKAGAGARFVEGDSICFLF